MLLLVMAEDGLLTDPDSIVMDVDRPLKALRRTGVCWDVELCRLIWLASLRLLPFIFILLMSWLMLLIIALLLSRSLSLSPPPLSPPRRPPPPTLFRMGASAAL